MFPVFLIAFSLALDAFAVSVSCGISVRDFNWRKALLLGCWFGAFQFAMPLIGWFLGSRVSEYIEAFDYLVAFVLLSLIGGHMVLEATTGGSEEKHLTYLTVHRLAALALATSIDALAVGVSMALLDVSILPASTVIGLVAFVLSALGGMLGKKLGVLFRRRAVIAGGLVLIGIGLKMLLQHFF